MSLTEIAGHRFTDGLMRDRCSRCDIRWSDAIANRSPCTGHSMTDHYNAQYDEARQEVWNAVVGDSAGTEPVAPDAYEPEGDAAEPFMDIGTNPYCFSFGGYAIPEAVTFGFPDSLTWGEILALLEDRA